MRTLAFDGRMGASGDMLLAALLAAGADPAVLEPVEDALPVEYVVGETEKNGIQSTTVDVVLTEGDAVSPSAGSDDPAHDHHEHSHEDDHQHDHHHHHEHPHQHEHTHAEGHGPHRTYAEVVELVEGMGLPAGIEADATAIFRVLGEAESGVHGTALAETHFHEVGADDAIADVVGVCLLLADLGIERVVTTPLAVGGGTVGMSHGTYPVPTPAVVNIAAEADWELVGGPVEAELLTPTGAAILAHIANGVESLPTIDITASGYGGGGHTFPDHPNVLRALVGEVRGGLVREEIRLLETNVDDVTPEVLGSLQETLFAAGARDVTVVPATMKKSRPGHVVKVVVQPGDVARVARTLAVETGTLGVRETSFAHRWVAERRFETVRLEIEGETYEVEVKVASDEAGEVYDVSAEYDDCVAVAGETGLPVREVQRRAENAAR
jgi:uncharacterized protein (TIGR00299 family) protein